MRGEGLSSEEVQRKDQLIGPRFQLEAFNERDQGLVTHCRKQRWDV